MIRLFLLTRLQEREAAVSRSAGFYRGAGACAFCGWTYGEDVGNSDGGYEDGCGRTALAA